MQKELLLGVRVKNKETGATGTIVSKEQVLNSGHRYWRNEYIENDLLVDVDCGLWSPLWDSLHNPYYYYQGDLRDKWEDLYASQDKRKIILDNISKKAGKPGTVKIKLKYLKPGDKFLNIKGCDEWLYGPGEVICYADLSENFKMGCSYDKDYIYVKFCECNTETSSCEEEFGPEITAIIETQETKGKKITATTNYTNSKQKDNKMEILKSTTSEMFNDLQSAAIAGTKTAAAGEAIKVLAKHIRKVFGKNYPKALIARVPYSAELEPLVLACLVNFACRLWGQHIPKSAFLQDVSKLAMTAQMYELAKPLIGKLKLVALGVAKEMDLGG